MENYHSAFLAGEYASLRDERTLSELQKLHSGDPSKLGLHTVVSSNMAAHAGKRVRIVGVSYYHFGWVLYELDGIPGHWPEAAMIDQDFERDEAVFQPANLTYRAAESDDQGSVCICDFDGRVYCTLRKRDVKSAVDNINRVAALRSRASFSNRYNFDGIELFENPTTG